MPFRFLILFSLICFLPIYAEKPTKIDLNYFKAKGYTNVRTYRSGIFSGRNKLNINTVFYKKRKYVAFLDGGIGLEKIKIVIYDSDGSRIKGTPVSRKNQYYLEFKIEASKKYLVIVRAIHGKGSYKLHILSN